MSQAMDKAQKSQLRTDFPEFRPGDTVRVNVKLREIETGEKGGEKEKERIQPFEGVVIKRRGHTAGASFTVRRVSFGIGVERIFPLHSPMIASVEIVQQGNVRRAKLYYLRGLKGKSARIKRAARVEQPVEAKAAE